MATAVTQSSSIAVRSPGNDAWRTAARKGKITQKIWKIPLFIFYFAGL